MTVGPEKLWNYQTVVPRSVRSIIVSPQLETILGFLAFEIAYYFAFAIGISFRPVPASPFWFPNAVLLCALLKSRRELWWLFILGTLPIRLLSDSAGDIPLWFKLTTFGIGSVEGLITALVLRRFMRNPLRLETLRDLAVFAAFAVVLVPAVSAFGGAASRQMLGADFWTVWTDWFMGDVLAQLVVTPVVLYWVFGAAWNAKTLDVRRLGEAALLTAGLLLSQKTMKAEMMATVPVAPGMPNRTAAQNRNGTGAKKLGSENVAESIKHQ
jgi:integral membrane sensor domain MASE1